MEESPEREIQALQKVIQECIERLDVPLERPPHPFILGIIGNIGSGKTTIAKKLQQRLPGLVSVAGDSIRFLLKEHNLPWGDNVKYVLRGVVTHFMKLGYGVIVDSGIVQPEDRLKLESEAARSHTPLAYVRVHIDPAVAQKRLEEKYSDSTWQSSFKRFRVKDTDAMVRNLHQRTQQFFSHEESIPNTVGSIDNTKSLEELDVQVDALVDDLKKAGF